MDSTRAVTTLLNRLNRLSDNSREVKLQILEQSVTNSWKGIFPLKGGQAQTRKESQNDMSNNTLELSDVLLDPGYLNPELPTGFWFCADRRTCWPSRSTPDACGRRRVGRH